MLVIQRAPLMGNNQRISTTYPQIIDELQNNERVLIDDGNIELAVESKSGDDMVCRCVRGGILGTRQGINLPDTDLHIDALTAKDLKDLQWSIEQQLDYLALSFVRHPKDLQQLREHLPIDSCDIAVIAKIEKPEALEHLDAIIDASDAILGPSISLPNQPFFASAVITRLLSVESRKQLRVPRFCPVKCLVDTSEAQLCEGILELDIRNPPKTRINRSVVYGSLRQPLFDTIVGKLSPEEFNAKFLAVARRSLLKVRPGRTFSRDGVRRKKEKHVFRRVC